MGQIIKLPKSKNPLEEEGFPFLQLTAEVMQQNGYGRNARHKPGEFTFAPEDDAIQTVMSE